MLTDVSEEITAICASCLHHQGAERLVNIYLTTWRNISEGSHLQNTESSNELLAPLL
jgi:hypothetical protein